MRRLIPLLYLALAACSKTPACYEDYIGKVTLSATDNVLRYRVDIQTLKACEPVVELREANSSQWHTMPGNDLVFLYPETLYEYRVRVGDLCMTPESFTTGSLPEEVPSFTVEGGEGPKDGYLMQTKESAPGYITLCDMQGRVVWYQAFEDGVRCAHFDPEQGKIAVLLGYKTEQASTGAWRPRYGSKIAVITLGGERITDFDASVETTPYPHHEIKLMPDGNIITVEAVAKDIDLNGYNGNEQLEIWGDGYVILSPEGERLASWDIFEELDVAANTSWLYPAEYQYDLVHANSVSWDENGDFYMTFHYIAEIWKIDGKTGKVLYRLGEHGNVQLDGPYAEGGFHAVVPLSADRFLVNNNAQGAGAVTHAQIYEVNASAKTARRTLNVANKPEYSVYTGGNVELLPDGKTLHFDSTGPKVSVFTDLEGNVLKVFHRKDNSYRAFYFESLFPAK